MQDDLILKYIDGSASVEEKRQVLRWISQKEGNRKYFNRMKNQWVIAHLPSEKASPAELEEMKRIIRRQQRNRNSSIIYKVAAVLVLPLLIANGVLISSMKKMETQPISQTPMALTLVPLDTVRPYITYKTTRGIKGKAELPDGSIVWLNSDSYIRVPVVFDSTERVVEFSGEGYFDVVSNPTIPMKIKTKKNVELIIHGTKFNLASYGEDNQVTTSLYEGAITVYDYNNNDVVKMQPNTTMTFQKGRPNHAKKLEAMKDSDKWMNGELIFDNTPFPEIALKLERWYGIHIVITDSTINNYTFTGHFYSESISQVLDLFQASSDLKYRINKNEVIISK